MRNAAALTLCLLSAAFLAGCFGEQIQFKSSPFGVVVLTDTETCERIQVLGEEVKRDQEGRLVLKVQWLNVTDMPYKAQLRVTFSDIELRRERDSYLWDLQTFRPGEQAIEWTSNTPDAVRYRVEVRELD